MQLFLYKMRFNTLFDWGWELGIGNLVMMG